MYLNGRNKFLEGMIKYSVLGNGIGGRFGSHIYLAFLCDDQQMPVMIWHGPSLYKTSGAGLRIDQIDDFIWAFECTNTMWFYTFLKAFPAEQTLTFAIVNAEYRKHHGEDMILSED